MDVNKMLQELREERYRFDIAIAALKRLAVRQPKRPGRPPNWVKGTQTLLVPQHTPGRRGRTSMPEEERAKVSERMKLYWARRRGENKLPKVVLPNLSLNAIAKFEEQLAH